MPAPFAKLPGPDLPKKGGSGQNGVVKKPNWPGEGHIRMRPESQRLFKAEINKMKHRKTRRRPQRMVQERLCSAAT
jgi:hypothetical protein